MTKDDHIVFPLQPSSKALILLSFGLPILYWIYLFFSAQPHIVFDAIGYEDTGKMIYSQGWIPFFQTGPQREPLYPLMIAFSMQIGDWLSVSYLEIQKIVQLLFLLTSQLLVFHILKKLKISPFVSAIVILYMGFSPALVNSSLSLFSEIATYPFVLGIILIAARSWKLLLDRPKVHLLLYGFLLGLLFIALTCVKVIFNYVFIFFLFPFFFLALKELRQKNFKKSVIIIGFVFSVMCPFYVFMTSYKLLNKKYNGFYEFTNRLGYLYGNTELRTNPMTKTRFLAAIASVPGENACRVFIAKEECDYWAPVSADGAAHLKTLEFLDKGIPKNEWNREFLSSTKERIKERPILFAVFYFFENTKIFFWESTQIGCVKYPRWLKVLFDDNLLRNGLRFVVSFLTLWSLILMAGVVWKERVKVLVANDAFAEGIQICFFILLMIGCFSALNSIVRIIPRYLFSMAPLYLIAMGLFLQRFLSRNK